MLLATLLFSYLLVTSMAKSPKRGVAYNLQTQGDIGAVSLGASWWYNWAPKPDGGIPGDYRSRFNMEFIPMLWNDNFNMDEAVNYIKSSGVKHFMVLNEPNLKDQSNMSPQRAAEIWKRFEEVAERSGAAIVGPQITWGTLDGFQDPVVWMDAFYAAYRAQNGGRDPRIDYLGFHWYDYGLSEQLDRLKKFGKKFWVTEMANWHSGDDAKIDSEAKQKVQARKMVKICESRDDVARYAWFTGRWTDKSKHTDLLLGDGVLSDLGYTYATLP